MIGTGGSLAGTAVTVGGATATIGSTPTLGGVGPIGGATVIAAASGGAVGTHAPGIAGVANGVGTQTFSSTLTYGSGSIFEWNLTTGAEGTAGTDFDSVGLDTATGSLTVDSNATTGAIFKVVPGEAFVGGNEFWSAPTQKTWNVFAATNTATLGTSTNIFSRFQLFDSTSTTEQVDFSSFGSFGFTSNGSTGTLTWTAVPEPTSALAGLLITAGLLRRRCCLRLKDLSLFIGFLNDICIPVGVLEGAPAGFLRDHLRYGYPHKALRDAGSRTQKRMAPRKRVDKRLRNADLLLISKTTMTLTRSIERDLSKLVDPEHYLFTLRDLAGLMPGRSEAALKASVGRLTADGVLERVCRGLYLYPGVHYPSDLVLYHSAARLRADELCYLSLESVLSDAGVISQIPINWITLMTSAVWKDTPVAGSA